MQYSHSAACVSSLAEKSNRSGLRYCKIKGEEHQIKNRKRCSSLFKFYRSSGKLALPLLSCPSFLAVSLNVCSYISAEQQLDLFNKAQIRLENLLRKNQSMYKKQPYIFRNARKRIETLYSQLCNQFMIRRNYAKSFEGFKTRIISKITALTVIQYINHLNNIKINQIKINIA